MTRSSDNHAKAKQWYEETYGGGATKTSGERDNTAAAAATQQVNNLSSPTKAAAAATFSPVMTRSARKARQSMSSVADSSGTKKKPRAKTTRRNSVSFAAAAAGAPQQPNTPMSATPSRRSTRSRMSLGSNAGTPLPSKEKRLLAQLAMESDIVSSKRKKSVTSSALLQAVLEEESPPKKQRSKEPASVPEEDGGADVDMELEEKQPVALEPIVKAPIAPFVAPSATGPEKENPNPLPLLARPSSNSQKVLLTTVDEDEAMELAPTFSSSDTDSPASSNSCGDTNHHFDEPDIFLVDQASNQKTTKSGFSSWLLWGSLLVGYLAMLAACQPGVVWIDWQRSVSTKVASVVGVAPNVILEDKVSTSTPVASTTTANLGLPGHCVSNKHYQVFSDTPSNSCQLTNAAKMSIEGVFRTLRTWSHSIKCDGKSNPFYVFSQNFIPLFDYYHLQDAFDYGWDRDLLEAALKEYDLKVTRKTSDNRVLIGLSQPIYCPK